jgi:hypothetical protein
MIVNSNRFRKDFDSIYSGRVIFPPPASQSQVDETEQMLGFALPPLLKKLYTEVGNGGFGWGNGLIGIAPNGWQFDTSGFLIDGYPSNRDPLIQLENGVKAHLIHDEYLGDHYWPMVCWNGCDSGCSLSC